eukprot:TCONS_00042871-protein
MYIKGKSFILSFRYLYTIDFLGDKRDVNNKKIIIHFFHFSYMRTCLKNHKANVLDKISKDEIRSELSLRGIKFLMDDLKPALLAKLVEEMAGIHRLPALLRNKIDPDFYNLLLQIIEIQEIIYLNEVHRTNAKVFRYLNQSFLHLVAMEELMP